MNYMNIIKSRNTRVKIMQVFSFVPDKWIVKLQYRVKTGHRLNLKNPTRFTEKLQWYKLFYRDSLMKQCVDKYSVRDYVKSCDFEKYLVPLLGIYNASEEIDWEKLPRKFVAKDTLGCGGNSVILVSDKSTVNKQAFLKRVDQWVQPIKGKHPGREWVYDNAQHRILIEEFIDSEVEAGGLIDYKFFCFNGKAEYIYVIADRLLGKGAGCGIFSSDFVQLPYQRLDENLLTRKVEKPNNFAELLLCAEKLAEPFPEARIDLYDQNGKILFGEITFFDGSGYMTFEPDSFDFKMGEMFVLPI